MHPPTHLLGSSAITENLLKRRWSIVILRHFDGGLKEPEQILKLEEDLSPGVMNERLRTLLRYCLLAKYPRASRSRSAEYRLTAKGRRILRMLELINQLDRFSDQDPRSLEEILRADLGVKPPPPIVLESPPPVKPAVVQISNSTRKTPTVRLRSSA
jgi:DNA-binding HxlR family transcriptional regulator